MLEAVGYARGRVRLDSSDRTIKAYSDHEHRRLSKSARNSRFLAPPHVAVEWSGMG